MATYGLKYQDRNGFVRVRDFETSEAREAWATKAIEHGTADAILAWSDPAVVNPETGKATQPHMTREGHPVELPELPSAEAVRDVSAKEAAAMVKPAGQPKPSYGAAEVAECLRDTLIGLVDVTDGPLPIVAWHQKVSELSDVSTEDIDVCGHMADFEVQTSDGRTFRVRLSETYRS